APGLHAAALGYLVDVLAIVDTGRVERGRDHGDQQLDPTQDARVRGLRVAVERATGDLGQGGAVDDPVRDGFPGLEAAPFHGRSPFRNAPTSRLKMSGRSKYVEWPAASTRSKREPGTCRCTVSDSSGQMRPSSALVRNIVGIRVAAHRSTGVVWRMSFSRASSRIVTFMP